MAIIATAGVPFTDSTLVIVSVSMQSDDDRGELGAALAEVDEWCGANGYHRVEANPTIMRIENQFVLNAQCVKD